MPSTTSSFSVPRTIGGAQPSIRLVVKIKEKQEADELVGRCFLWSDIPFSTAKNNSFYRSMFDSFPIVGSRNKAPTYDKLRGHILYLSLPCYLLLCLLL
jgi:hypothetical protein